MATPKAKSKKANKSKAKIPPNPPPKKKRKPGRPSIPVLTPARLEDALRRSMGNMTRAAKRLKVHRSSVQEHVHRCPALRAVIAEAEETFKDTAVDSLYQQVKKGNIAAIIWTLKTKGKDRGYVEEKQLPPLEMLLALLGPELAAALRARLSQPTKPLAEVNSNEPIPPPPPVLHPQPVPDVPPVSNNGTPGTVLPVYGAAPDPLRPSLNGNGHVPGQGQNHPSG